MIINMQEICGDFAENKDKARKIRNEIKAIYSESDDKIVLDFKGVDSTTQSFIHALLSGFFQNYGELALERFEFKNCTAAVKSLITTVINYSLE